MLRYLNGELNRRGRPNENYARELMELFCLGVTDTSGNPNYTETDVRELARALSGWTIDATDPNNPRGLFNASRFDTGSKTLPGRAPGTFGSRQAVDIVLAHPQHAEPPRAKALVGVRRRAARRATLADLTATYTAKRAPAQAAAQEDPHAPTALRLAGRADADQAADRLRGRRLQAGRLERHQHRPVLASRRDGAAALLPPERLRLGVRGRIPDDERRAQPMGLRLGSRRPPQPGRRGGRNARRRRSTGRSRRAAARG